MRAVGIKPDTDADIKPDTERDSEHDSDASPAMRDGYLNCWSTDWLVISIKYPGGFRVVCHTRSKRFANCIGWLRARLLGPFIPNGAQLVIQANVYLSYLAASDARAAECDEMFGAK